MFGLLLPNMRSLRVLCLGAHCDDIEIGCGGTILNLAAAKVDMEIRWIVFSSNEERKKEALKSADAFLGSTVNRQVIIHSFRDGFLPYVWGEIKDRFEELKNHFSPDLILTHHSRDLHQDHRLISELTWNTFRNHLILEYEIPKYDGDFGSPNVFAPLNELICRQKIETIIGAYQTQREKSWFARDLFLSVLRVRGMEANASSGYAEGFYCRKAVLDMEGSCTF
jgi:LmbE family N-acetylglucosaminyl deacetylase